MSEIQVLGVIDDALSKMTDPEAIQRILAYINDKYEYINKDSKQDKSPSNPKNIDGDRDNNRNENKNEMAGIAMMTDSGEFRLTVRDPKAKNTNDAAIRLAIIAIFAYCRLSGERSASSKNIVKPILEKWRAYTGNTRAALAKHPGILRDGDSLSLDYHAMVEAEQYINDVIDTSVVGTWQPSGIKGRTA